MKTFIKAILNPLRTGLLTVIMLVWLILLGFIFAFPATMTMIGFLFNPINVPISLAAFLEGYVTIAVLDEITAFDFFKAK